MHPFGLESAEKFFFQKNRGEMQKFLRLMCVIDPTNSFVIECDHNSTVGDVKRLTKEKLNWFFTIDEYLAFFRWNETTKKTEAVGMYEVISETDA